MKTVLLMFALCPLMALAAPVNVNQADAETISEALTGIGSKKAEAIVKYREEHGHFQTLDDLKKVNGIGDKTIQQNEKDILFSGELAQPLAEEKQPQKSDKASADQKAK
ncbi:ComEA family DNA-binding protein [Methylomonas sp. MgM2]